MSCRGYIGVDIGNTSVKATLFRSCDNPLFLGSFLSVEETAIRCKEVSGAKIGYCTTRELTPEEQSAAIADGWWELTNVCSLPVAHEYKTPQTLGPDRIAAVVGASAEKPGKSVLIADVGTALTLDVLLEGKRFIGGNISPGLKMRFDALSTMTSKLPPVEIWGNLPGFGYDTETAIRAGVVRGMVNEIVGTFGKVRKKYGCRELLLTGGGVEFLIEAVAEDIEDNGNISYCPWLVERGVVEAYKYNHDEN